MELSLSEVYRWSDGTLPQHKSRMKEDMLIVLVYHHGAVEDGKVYLKTDKECKAMIHPVEPSFNMQHRMDMHDAYVTAYDEAVCKIARRLYG